MQSNGRPGGGSRYDVLVVGFGLAGMMAALEAARHGRRVALLFRNSTPETNSYAAQGGIAAAIGPGDDPRSHAEDTIIAARGLHVGRAVDTLVEEGPRVLRQLLAWGVPFDRDYHGLAMGLEGGHRRPRVVHAHGAATGKAVADVLAARVRHAPAVDLVEGHVAVELLVEDDQCQGVLALDLAARQWRPVRAAATILATGGACALYGRTTNPPGARGDGIAMAFRAGAALADMEFVQFHPTALAPATGRGPCLLLSEALRGHGGILLNARGERFMPRYDPLAELAPRDVVARAIWWEMQGTGASHVYLSMAGCPPDDVERRFPSLVAACRAIGLDLARAPVPVAPAAHYLMGGILTGLSGETTLPGLFACGEVACTGVHGANRLASNSLLECLVFGQRAGAAAAAGLEPAAPRWRLAPAIEPDQRALGRAAPMLARLGRLGEEHLGIVRTGSGLRAFLDETGASPAGAVLRDPADRPAFWLGQSAEDTGALRDAVALDTALTVSRLIATAADLRQESRGAHYRSDFPQEDPAWQRHIVLAREQPPMVVRARDSFFEEDWFGLEYLAGKGTAARAGGEPAQQGGRRAG